MRFVIACLLGLSVLAAPCVYDTDPREPGLIATLLLPAIASGQAPAFNYGARIASRITPAGIDGGIR